jgi:hypothetical protein
MKSFCERQLQEVNAALRKQPGGVRAEQESLGRQDAQPEVIDPVLHHHPTRRSVGYFGAVESKVEQWASGKQILRRLCALTECAMYKQRLDRCVARGLHSGMVFQAAVSILLN